MIKRLKSLLADKLACKHGQLELIRENGVPVAWRCIYCRKYKEPYEGMERWM